MCYREQQVVLRREQQGGSLPSVLKDRKREGSERETELYHVEGWFSVVVFLQVHISSREVHSVSVDMLVGDT